jgi:hypothetical protein
MGADTLLVRRAGLDMEEPWVMPPGVTSVRLRRSTDGAPPRLATSVAAFFDDQSLFVLFSGADDHVEATYLTHDANLFEQDVFEVFLAPDGLTRYYELEVSPRGTLFDARIESPDGERRTMKADRSWTCDGLVAAVRRARESEGLSTIDTVLRVPFASLGRETPREGEAWRCNFFRIDRHPTHGDEYSAWQPTLRTPPDFHVASAFGTLRFVRE